MSGISKLIIKAYSDEGFSVSKGDFSASINPAHLKIVSSVDYDTSQGMGSSSMALRYNVSPPRSLYFKLLFDNTGVIPESDAKVKDQLDSLYNIIYNFQDELSSPYYIRVIWGVIDFKGKLVNLETSYTMFQADGAPIRAEVDIAILEDVNPSSISQAIKAQSDAATAAGTNGGAAPAAAAVAEAAAGAVAGGAATSSQQSTENDANSNNETAGAGGNQNNPENNSSNAGSNTDPTTSDNGSEAGSTSPENTGNSSNSGKSTDNNNPAATTNPQGSNTTPAATNQPTTDGAAASPTPAAGEDPATPAGSGLQQVKAGDSVPSIAKSALGDPNLAKKLGLLNDLDSLRGLADGLKLAIPFSVAGLLAGLLALLEKYAKDAWNYLKKKAEEGKDKAIQVKDKVKSKI